MNLKKIIIICIILITFSLSIFAEENLDNIHNNFDFTLSPENGVMQGIINVVIPKQLIEGNKIYFMLPLNFMSQAKKGFNNTDLNDLSKYVYLSEFFINETKLEYYYSNPYNATLLENGEQNCMVTVTIPEEIIKNKTDAITISYKYISKLSTGSMSDDLKINNYYGSRFNLLPQVITSEKFLKKYYKQLTPFTYNGKIKIEEKDKNWILVRTGNNFNKKDNAYTFSMNKPIVSLPIFAIKNHNKYEINPSENDDFQKTITIYLKNREKSDNETIKKYLAKIAKESLTYYQNLYFELDYDNISILEGMKDGYYGMASDGFNILSQPIVTNILDKTKKEGQKIIEEVIAHELGHFYFGIGSSADFMKENYLSESFNEYSTIKYMEQKYGIDNTRMKNNSFRTNKYYTTLHAYKTGRINLLSTTPDNKIINYSQVTDYNKGYIILRMLEKATGNNNFDEFLKYYLQENRYKLYDSKILNNLLNKFYNKNFDWFFNDYIYGNRTVDNSIKAEFFNKKHKNEYKSVFILNQDSKNFISTELFIEYKNGKNETIEFTESKRIEVVSKYKIKKVIVDKYINFYDVNRNNNTYPKTIFKVKENQWLENGEAITVSPAFGFSFSELLDTFYTINFTNHIAWDLSITFQTNIIEKLVYTEQPHSNFIAFDFNYLFNKFYYLNNYFEYNFNTKIIEYYTDFEIRINPILENITVSKFELYLGDINFAIGSYEFDTTTPSNNYIYNQYTLSLLGDSIQLIDTLDYHIGTNQLKNNITLKLASSLNFGVVKLGFEQNWGYRNDFGYSRVYKTSDIPVENIYSKSFGDIDFTAYAGKWKYFKVVGITYVELFNNFKSRILMGLSFGYHRLNFSSGLHDYLTTEIGIKSQSARKSPTTLKIGLIYGFDSKFALYTTYDLLSLF